MKLLICDKVKIKYYNIPNEVKDFYTINYTTKDSFENITLIEHNNQWIIKSDAAINLIQNDTPINKFII